MKLATGAAAHYRQRNNRHGGIVIFNAGVATQWLPALPPAKDWQPGIKAEDVDGNQWTAWGGNEYGAEFWRQLNG